MCEMTEIRKQDGCIANGDRGGLFVYGQRNQTPNTVIFPPANVTIPTDADSQAGLAKLQALSASWNRKQDQDVFLLKTDYEISSSHHLSLRYNRQDFTGKGFENGGTQNSFEHTGDSLVKTDTLSGSLASSLSPRIFNELRGQYAKDSEPGTANSANPEATIRQAGTLVLTIGRNFFSPRETTIKRLHTPQFGGDYAGGEGA